MADTNKSYRIHTTVGDNSNIMVQLDQNYDVLEVLSIKLKDEDTYRLHSSNYGVIVGRVIANGGFGVPNAKISVFIEGNFDDSDVSVMYPYKSTASIGPDGKRYNLLPDEQVDKYHKAVGSFPNKTYLLDNDVLIEVFDKYYKYTTRTNNSGDYLICGVPTGNQTLHMDLDISDCGILSQRPRDFVYKGYTIEQFENPNQFKESDNLESLSQVFSQDQVVNVIPFWGDISEGESIGITRADINIAFKFEPTCVFMGSVVADNASNGISKKCVPTNNMGAMDELTTGEGTIEMIRKTPMGDIEEFQVKGTQLIDGNGVWCYQIPMNLDYVMTDEYGNLVPTDDPDKGIPTRTRVRFRISMHDFEKNTDNYFRAKVLVPHNPQDLNDGHEGYDYEFGSETRDDSFRDLFWNNVYTVKSYIPRFQKSKSVKNERFTGIKHCNIYGQNNPLPYNNIRIRLPLMFTIMCALLKAYVWIISILNFFQTAYAWFLVWMADKAWFFSVDRRQEYLNKVKGMTLSTLYEGLCPDLDWFFAPVAGKWGKEWATSTHQAEANDIFKGGGKIFGKFLNLVFKPLGINFTYKDFGYVNLLIQTYNFLNSESTVIDANSVDEQNRDDDESVCITINTDYLISCIEMALAQEYKVINFDFYNDWINGVIYMPRWMRHIRPKMTFLFGLIKVKPKMKACMDDSTIFGKTRRYTQQCTLTYKKVNNKAYTSIVTNPGCSSSKSKQKCHKEGGWNQYAIFGSGKGKFKGNGGTVHEHKTSKDQFVYYFKPCEWNLNNGKKAILFANDIVLLGSLNDCDQYGIPQAFKHLTSSTYIMPTNLALTNMDDDAAAYAGDDGTYCGGKVQTFIEENQMEKLQTQYYDPQTGGERLHQIPLTYSATSHYYSTSTTPIEYNDNDDSIPITEAAGIAWNYTGPGQGVSGYTPNKKNIYLPGGHFLGISCVNAQTNIKSCINLQRICEAGTTMSQRREVVRKIEGTEPPSVRYRYFVPTGFISNSDIVDSDFRTMFATMNHKRLLCSGDVINRDTGYPIYDFMYLKTNGFNGSFSGYTMSTSNYNQKLEDLDDETSWMRNKFGARGFEVAEDYDKEEKTQTYRKTVETLNNDYYMFRLGVNDLKAETQDKRYLNVGSNGNVSLPQYENSFYFYFGLKDGSTALDELNKQFFAEVESKSVVMNAPSISCTYKIDECELNADLTVTANFLSTPITITIENSANRYREVVELNGLKHVFENLPFGTYTITVEDSTETIVEKTVDVGLGAIKMVTNESSFDFRVGTETNTSTISRKGKEDESGYIEFDKNFTVNGVSGEFEVGNGEAEILILNKNDGKYYVYNSEIDITSYSEILNSIGAIGTQIVTGVSDDGERDILTPLTNAAPLEVEEIDGTVRVYLWSPDSVYAVYLIKYCNGTISSCNFIREISIKGVDGFDLYLGSTWISYNEMLKDLSREDLIKRASDNDPQGWLMRHSLFRQTDVDTDLFENKVFAFDKNGRSVRTALFGQPELDGGVYVDGDTYVWYADDSFAYDGDLSDTSVIPTWGKYPIERYDFSEMGVNDTAICSDSLGSFNVTSVSLLNADDSLYNFVIDRIPAFPNNSPAGETVSCVAKVNGGTLLYCTTTKDENMKTYRYYGDELTVGDKVKIFPTFFYPVMYRPFYADMTFLVWDTKYLDTVTEDGETSFEVTNGYSWTCNGEIRNGITYDGKFSEVLINDENHEGKFLRVGDDCTPDNDDTIINGYVENYDVNDGMPYASFSIKEGAPSSFLEESGDEYTKINTPYPQSLVKIEGYLDGDFEDDIYCAEGDTDGTYVFLSGNTSTEYYLLNKQADSPFDYKQLKVVSGKSGKEYFVYGKYNQKALAMSELNKQSERFFMRVKLPSLLNSTTTIEYSIYDSEEDLEKKVRTIKASGRSGSNSTISDALCVATYSTIKGGPLGVNGRDRTIRDYLEDCGITLIVTYEYVGAEWTAPDILNSINRVRYLDRDKIISFGREMRIEGKIDEYFVAAMKEADSGEKGKIRMIKLYPEITVLSEYENAGVTPKLEMYDDADFPTSGGSTPLIIKSNVNWELSVYWIDEDKMHENWLILSDPAGNETVLKGGTKITGYGNVDYKITAKRNYDGVGWDFVGGYHGYEASLTIQDTNGYDLYSDVYYFQQGVPKRCRIEWRDTSSGTKTLSSAGGSGTVDVDSNMRVWDIYINGRHNRTGEYSDSFTVSAGENTSESPDTTFIMIRDHYGAPYEELKLVVEAPSTVDPDPDPPGPSEPEYPDRTFYIQIHVGATDSVSMYEVYYSDSKGNYVNETEITTITFDREFSCTLKNDQQMTVQFRCTSTYANDNHIQIEGLPGSASDGNYYSTVKYDDVRDGYTYRINCDLS